jgi:hypothetical protein
VCVCLTAREHRATHRFEYVLNPIRSANLDHDHSLRNRLDLVFNAGQNNQNQWQRSALRPLIVGEDYFGLVPIAYVRFVETSS